VLTRITLPGALFLALISVLPDYLIRWFNVRSISAARVS